MPQVRHLEHIGLAFEHLTLARKQPSQDARRRGWRCLVAVAMAAMGRRSRDIEAVVVVGGSEGRMRVEVELEWDSLSRRRVLIGDIADCARSTRGMKLQQEG